MIAMVVHTYAELTDMHFIYGRAKGISNKRDVFMLKLIQIARFPQIVCLEEFTKNDTGSLLFIRKTKVGIYP